jgi:hypothetical protein
MDTERAFERRRIARGEPYTLEEFCTKYGLDPVLGKDLYFRFGPSSIELDILMAAKMTPPNFNVITEEISL